MQADHVLIRDWLFDRQLVGLYLAYVFILTPYLMQPIAPQDLFQVTIQNEPMKLFLFLFIFRSIESHFIHIKPHDNPI